ncbi:hypothetical protein FB45DRAFT_738023 [Roridomyces roridus]|uniref:Uncharacterized protein n=1 Tax=Roridomyces roridus TaxID=1738132 RepID=A0AAD7C7W0_9AGAR|nr:hypothetical protein FB45DRAFT_738023 [Roridomyces roridus]
MAEWDYFQLSAFDTSCSEVAFTTAWLIQGTIDIPSLSAALDGLTERWRMLAGRIEPSDKPGAWRVQVPKGDFAPEYRRYALTTAVSDTPISDYVTLPLLIVSPTLPVSLFVAPATPTSNKTYVQTQHPLISIHVTALPNSGFAAIGFTVPHGVFDATGMALLQEALEAQLHAREWNPPSHPDALNAALSTHVVRPVAMSFFYKISTVVMGALRSVYDCFWNGACDHLVVVPEAVHLGLVDQIRALSKVRVSSSDVLAAWFYKTLYSKGTPARRTVRLVTFSSFRPSIPNMSTYPHNAFIRNFCPQTSVGDLAQRPLEDIALSVFQSRQNQGTEDVMAVYDAIASHGILDCSTCAFDCRGADELFWVNNCSSLRSTELRWPGVSAVKWANRYMRTESGFQLSNIISVMGRMDGDLLLHVNVSKAKLSLLEKEIQRLAAKD